MLIKKFIYLAVLLSFVSVCHATGLMMPVAKGYPKDFLRLRSTEVTVNINGIVAETVVYQEFENEWSDSTDVVYSFPLPADARATDFIYWYNGKAYRAVLQVKEQSTNPGTGEGGVAALVNKYIGTNGIKIALKGIKAWAIQQCELHYISLCDYYKGKATYTFPLNTGDFLKYPIDNVRFNFNVSSNTAITNVSMSPYTDYNTLQQSSGGLNLQLTKPKLYLDQDMKFSYETDITKLGVDFYSAANDTTDGHFALFVRPQNQAVADSVFRKSVIFMLSNNSNMQGVKLEASKTAISKSLDMLTQKDFFNIVLFSYSPSSWKSAPVAATPANIQSAKDYLAAVTLSYGSDLQTALKQTLTQLNDTTGSNSILIFCESGANVDPQQIEKLNTGKIGIFPIGIGEQVSRTRLEMTAALNYGFVTYINTEDSPSEKMTRVFSQISQPVLKDVRFEYGKITTSQMLPAKIPSTYAGSAFYIAGRFKSTGRSPLSIAGNSVKGLSVFDFILDFGNQAQKQKFTEYLWAKEMIDQLERQIEIYGETPSQKQLLISISLQYNIRCRYTAYIADYKTPSTGLKSEKAIIPVSSYIAGNYPNPFNPSTKIRVFLDESSAGKVKMLKIYNLLGRLVAVIDLSDLQAGYHEVFFNADDINGGELPSGIYFVRLQVGENVVSTFRINLIK